MQKDLFGETRLTNTKNKYQLLKSFSIGQLIY